MNVTLGLREVATGQLAQQFQRRDAAADLVAAGLDRSFNAESSLARMSRTQGSSSSPRGSDLAAWRLAGCCRAVS
jgi:hypothetical protein